MPQQGEKIFISKCTQTILFLVIILKQQIEFLSYECCKSAPFDWV